MHTKFFPDPCGQVVQNYHLVLRGKKPEDVKFLPPPKQTFWGRNIRPGTTACLENQDFLDPTENSCSPARL